MSTEKTFTGVGTSVDPNGIMKIRWTNGLAWRVNATIFLNKTPLISKWCYDNCQGNYHVSYEYIEFEYGQDAVYFKLKWK